MGKALVPTRSNEEQLIDLAKNGDRHAFGQLVRHHRKGVVNVVYRMCGDSNLAEDAAQEAFMRAWQHLASYRPRSSFRNWVYRIATNEAVARSQDHMLTAGHQCKNSALDAVKTN